MIIDCFPFFNELDLLEIRLRLLDDIVDRVVLVESTRTFSLNKKKLYYSENKERFKKYNKKIIHIIVDSTPAFFDRFFIYRLDKHCNGISSIIPFIINDFFNLLLRITHFI